MFGSESIKYVMFAVTYYLTRRAWGRQSTHVETQISKISKPRQPLPITLERSLQHDQLHNRVRLPYILPYMLWQRSNSDELMI